MQIRRLDKDAFVTETILMLTKFGDYLLTVESSLEHLKRSGLQQILGTFGSSGRLNSREAKRFFNAHRKRFDRDMSRFCRYSAITTLYSLFEVRARAFTGDFVKEYPAKLEFGKFAQLKVNKNQSFTWVFRRWLEDGAVSVKLSHPRMWNQLQDLSTIRNCIVHSHGDASLLQNPQRTKDAVRRTRKISFDNEGILTIEAEFALTVCERLHQFFKLLFRAAGYRLCLPPGYVERMQKRFQGFENEIADGIAKHDLGQTTNLGGSL